MSDDNSVGDESNELSRREMVKLSVATALVASASSVLAAEPVELVQTDVEIKMAEGTCDAALIHPKKGKHPGVLIWSDAFGLRPTLREMGARMAAQGYCVLIPNPFYRAGAAKTLEINPAKISFSNPDDRARLTKLMGGLQTPGAAESDAAAYIAFLDAQKAVDRKKKIGTQGYCMGGPLVFRTCASQSQRVGAGGSFHGGGLVTDSPTSPHLLIPKMKARLYVGIAANDDSRQPDAKDKLREAFDSAKVAAEIEVYTANHGWCMADMPLSDGKPIYDKAEADKAWEKLLALYKAALV